MRRCIYGGPLKVKSSGNIARCQVWWQDNEYKVWLDENWYSLDCFEIPPCLKKRIA